VAGSSHEQGVCHSEMLRQSFHFAQVLPSSIAMPRISGKKAMKTSSVASLIATGVKPSEIKFLAISHTDPDHTDNVELLPQSMLLVQWAE
jgi:hypothetical protein